MDAEGLARRPVAAVAITRRGAELAARLAHRLPAVELYVEQRWAGELDAPCRTFRLPLRPLVADLFARYPSLVLFTAVGAAVRLVAPLLSGKGRDPAVVTVDEAGRFVVCLLSGHLGRGEALAREVASALGATPVLTSASAALGLPALDLLGVDHGWRLEDEEHLTAVAAALVNGGPVAFYQDAGERPWTEPPPGIVEVASLEEAMALGVHRIVVSDRLLPAARDGVPTLLYRPRTLVAGVGCRRGVEGRHIAAFVRTVLESNDLSPLSLRCLATAEAKAGEPGLAEAAALLGIPLLPLPADRLRQVAGLVSPSASDRLLGLPSVSEASALTAAGAKTLLVPRTKDGRVTVAVARWEGRAWGAA